MTENPLIPACAHVCVCLCVCVCVQPSPPMMTTDANQQCIKCKFNPIITIQHLKGVKVKCVKSSAHITIIRLKRRRSSRIFRSWRRLLVVVERRFHGILTASAIFPDLKRKSFYCHRNGIGKPIQKHINFIYI